MPTEIPWKLLGYGIAALALAAVLWWVSSRIRVSYQAEQERDAAVANLAGYRESVETQARVAAAQQIKDQKNDAALTSRLAALEADSAALHRALMSIASTVERTDANGVRRLAINPDWWLCHSSELTRDAADAAACKAHSSDGDVPH